MNTTTSRPPVVTSASSPLTSSPAGRPAPEPGIESDDLLERAREAEAEQTAQLDTAPLESRYSAALVAQVEAKEKQVERIEDTLENLIARQEASLNQVQAKQPGLLAFPATRAQWQRQVAQGQAIIARLSDRLEQVRELRDAMGVHGPRIEELATAKLRTQQPTLAADYDELCAAQRGHQALMRQQGRGERQRSSSGLSLGLSIERRP